MKNKVKILWKTFSKVMCIMILCFYAAALTGITTIGPKNDGKVVQAAEKPAVEDCSDSDYKELYAPETLVKLVEPQQSEEPSDAEQVTEPAQPETVDEDTEAEQNEAPDASTDDASDTESESEATIEPIPSPTPTPVSETTPSAFVWPDPVDAAPSIPVPEIEGKVVSYGSFRSTTLTPLNTVLKWQAFATSETEVQILVEVKLESCSLQAVSNPVSLYVGDQQATIYSPLLNLGGTDFRTSDLGYKIFTIKLAEGESKTISFQADWPFDGTYSNTSISVITCGGNATIYR